MDATYYPALKAFLVAQTDPVLVDYRDTGNNGGMALWLNENAAPNFIVWRTSVTWDEIMLNGMNWARVDNLTVGKARIWDWMFQNGSNSMNPSKPNIRLGIDAAWDGTAADLAVRASVYTHCKRAATRAEKALCTPLANSGTDVLPATMTFEGMETSADARLAMMTV